MTERILSIELSLEEGNLLLIALAECPFKIVFELIGKLNQQAHYHFAEGVDQSGKKIFTFTELEIRLAIKALGKLPYEHVHHLLFSLKKQMTHQLQPESDLPVKPSNTYAGN
ncbi:hypothetical protein [Nitrosomonas aestuarii]|uniref:Uncharacterized protein n=1 Tax=Nitrosomonas aestuarii TaxID=52441 RepID=A0A1I3XYX4_9PROT|nr:hypothetical protein [Nitrosomonas aestuarii]PTN11646.1 hypothetical protein C8R11_10865 [Nitrosomonas aestuarii]SFK24713.1 hypothetical protein SAMN05216302_1002148 [Nitrosomonas aestuarii]